VQPVGVFGWTRGDNGVHFHRVTEPIRVLAELGHTAFYGAQLDDGILSTVDTVVASMLHYEQDTEAWHRLAELGTHRLVLDVDDWMWDPDWDPFKEAWPQDAVHRLYSNVERAHVVTTPSVPIASYLSRFNANVWVVPNTVPAYVLDIERPGPDQGNWVVYQGSPSHERDWGTAGVQLAKFLTGNPGWGVGFVGAELGDLKHWPSWRRPWTADRPTYYRYVSMGSVGIGPLRKTMFNIAKSSLRAVEYAALGVVPVLPDLDPYRSVIKTGHNGMLIRPHETLRGVLDDLAAEPMHIDRMSAQARADAANWTTEAAIEAWVEAWNSV
jgi:hypothetical protein